MWHLLYSIFQKWSIILKKRVIWIRLLTVSVDPHSLFHSFFTQNFQRSGLLWLGVNETGLTPLGEPMPNLRSVLFLGRGWGCYLHDSFISIIHSISLLHMSKWSDFMAPILLRWKTVLKYVYPQKWTCTPKWKHQGVHEPPNGNTTGYMNPQTEIWVGMLTLIWWHV